MNIPASRLYQILLAVAALGIIAAAAQAADRKASAAPAGPESAVPNPALQPPPGITPAQTRGWFPWDPKGVSFPTRTWTAKERREYEARVEWFHRARYGLMFHFLAFGDRAQDFHKGFRPDDTDWTSERWNQVVAAVDVEKTAEQAKEVGAGYVVLTLGQNHKYACAPNPVIDARWNLRPGQYNSTRDLPMALGRALEKRGIRLMLYIVATDQHQLPSPAGWTDADCDANWLEAVRWYSDHYGTLCQGWWVDGMTTTNPKKGPNWRSPEYPVRFAEALRRGNPGAIVGASIYGISDFLHGHCIGGQWEKQRTIVRPFFGRWDPDFNLQWHVLQYVGSYWGATDTPKQTTDLVQYAVDVVRGGGVFTFDVGSYKIVDGRTVPCLEIPPGQMAQLRAVRDALRPIPPSDGRGAVKP